MTWITTPAHALTFGPLNLIGTDAELALIGYKFEAVADETDLGDPVPIEQKVISWLQDGALLALTGYDNREDMTIRIRITGADSNKLARAEQTLMLQTGIRNTLTWTPPDGLGQPCVFDVIMSNLEYLMDDISELRDQRTYQVRIQAAPFARSQNPVTVTKPAPAGVQVLTTVDNGSSFTNWAGIALGATGGTVTTGVSGGTAVFVTNTNNTIGVSHLFNLKLTRTGLAAALGSTPYIRVDMSLALTNVNVIGPQIFFYLNGIQVPVATQTGNIYWLDTTGFGIGATLNTFAVEIATFYATSTSGTVATLAVADVSRSNVIGEPATNRQLARTVEVAGSARTQGSLSLTDAANALGTTLVYTSPSVVGMAQPNLRQFVTSSNSPSVDATTVSGSTSDLVTTHTFDVPITRLQAGTFSLMARVKHASAGAKAITWAAKSRMGGVNDTGETGITTVTVGAGTWQVFDIALIDLPTRLMGTAGLVRIELTGPSGLILDEAWIFNLDTGDLTWVECGTAAPAAGGSANRVWIDAATLDSPEPITWMGFAADRSDQLFAGAAMASNGVHNIAPPSINVFTVTTNSTASVLGLTHYPRWHTHVAA